MTNQEKNKRRALLVRRNRILTGQPLRAKPSDAARDAMSEAQKERWRRKKEELGFDPDSSLLDDTYGGPADADIAELPEALAL